VQHWAEERGEQRRMSGVGVKLLKWGTTSVEEGIRVTTNVGAREAVGGAHGHEKLRWHKTMGDGGPVGATAPSDAARRAR
jgi:hypothetical protein